jgi:hypothetical protein
MNALRDEIPHSTDSREACSRIDLGGDCVMPLKAVCRLIPGRTGKGLALTTVFRWALRGCKGTRLETWLIGGQRFTSRAAVDRFIAAINESKVGLSSDVHRRHHQIVEATLEREGL